MGKVKYRPSQSCFAGGLLLTPRATDVEKSDHNACINVSMGSICNYDHFPLSVPLAQMGVARREDEQQQVGLTNTVVMLLLGILHQS